MTFEFSDKDQNITVHNYDAEGFYLSTTENMLIEAHTGLPALATDVPPSLELKEGQKAKFNEESNQWLAVYDYRGQTVYNTATQESKTVEKQGKIEEGWTLQPPPENAEWDGEKWVTSLDLVRTSKYREINIWRDAEEAKPDRTVTANDIEWDADPTARIRIESTLSSTFIPPFWTDANNKDQPIDRDGLQAIHTAIVKAGFDIHARQREMKKEIAELTTIEAVQAYQVG